MKPPPLRNFVPVAPVREADRPRPPTFYQAQPRFSPAPLSHFKARPCKTTRPSSPSPSTTQGACNYPYAR